MEVKKCALSPAYFITTYIKIYDPVAKSWIPFLLWGFQRHVVDTLHAAKEFIGLKARQMGLTWILMAYALWLMLFRPIAECLVFSKREDEAMYLISNERLRGMYTHLPEFLQARGIIKDDITHFRLTNLSGIRAFPSNAGDSYSATFAFIDEADLVPDLKELLGRVEPTVNAGGKLALISRADKKKPNSYFKQLYRGAAQGENSFKAIFLPWHVHPLRDAAWYEKQSRNMTLDDLHEQYPATDAQALSARTSDKLLESGWVEQCYQKRDLLPLSDAPAISDLHLYAAPTKGKAYVLGVDPAEGKDTSDDSSITVLDVDTLEEVCHLSGKIHFAVLAGYADTIGDYYNQASIMVERNNHGHAVLLWLEEHSGLQVLAGHDDNTGWLSSARGKHIMYSDGGDLLKAGTPIIHSRKTYDQLISIERSTLRAPQGLADDAADSFVLALAGAKRNGKGWTGVW